MTRETSLNWLIPIGLFIAFFSYYSHLSEYLPFNAGPDETAHYDAVNFIYQNGHLANYPEDAESLNYTIYGTTRAFRPPLFYMSSAILSSFYEPHPQDGKFSFRKAASLYGALAVVFMFLATWLYTRSRILALLTALLTGLCPQIAFLSVYTSNDSSSIACTTLVFVALAWLYRSGITTPRLVFLGIAIGLTFLTKITAWVMFPALSVFVFLLVDQKIQQKLISAAVVASVGTLVALFWIGPNVVENGIENIINFPLQQELEDRFRRFNPESIKINEMNQITFVDLLLNKNGFLRESFYSAVGNLDWLRLRLGKVQYYFYLAVLVVAVAGYLIQSFLMFLGQRIVCAQEAQTPVKGFRANDWLFSTMLVFILISQLIAYIDFNISHDSQIQGRYLLTVNAALMLLFASSIMLFRNWLAEKLFFTKKAFPVLVALGCVSAGAVHAHALTKYVRPFYDDAFYSFDAKYFRPMENVADKIVRTNSMTMTSQNSRSFEARSNDYDPWFEMELSAFKEWPVPFIMRVAIASPNPSRFTVYTDYGKGYREHHASHGHYRRGTYLLYFTVTGDDVKRLRFDPRVGEGVFAIEEIAVAPVSWNQPDNISLYVDVFRRVRLGPSSMTVTGVDKSNPNYEQSEGLLNIPAGQENTEMSLVENVYGRVGGKWLLRMRFRAEKAGKVRFVYDTGFKSLSETTQVVDYVEGEQELLFFMTGRAFRSAKFYPAQGGSAVAITNMAIARVFSAFDPPRSGRLDWSNKQ